MDYEEIAREWAADDPEPAYSSEVLDLVQTGQKEALEELFQGRLAFGTAGLRAEMGPGPNRMNQKVVAQTTAGLLRWMSASGQDAPLVVIGFDARHHSAAYAAAAAEVIAQAGGKAMLADSHVPTPVLAKAILTHRADAGIVITASHNPPADNGYKLYLRDGIQIIPPADAEIAAAISEVAEGAELATFGAPTSVVMIRAQEWIGEHRQAILGLIPGSERQIAVCYTAMHGVGGAPFLAAVREAGFPEPTVVADQFEPDPDFKTVAFPNPEEEGALDLAIKAARSVGADAIVAHDPDADRLAVAVPDPDGHWIRLSGDQVGVLLADHLISAHRNGTSGGSPAVVAKSLVSSQRMEAIARASDIECDTTLTGFKWVARPILERPDHAYLLGYEEALGYCVGGLVRDKDGISAGLVAMQMLAALAASGRTVWDALADLDRRFGAYRTHSFSVRLHDTGPTSSQLLTAVLEDPPSSCGPVRRVVDLALGEDLPPTAGVIVNYVDDSRLIVRPSGTEPKVKFYLETVGEVEYAEKTLSLLTQELEERFTV